MRWSLPFLLVLLAIHRLHGENREINCIRKGSVRGFIDPLSGTQVPCYSDDGGSNCKVILFGSERLQCLKKCCQESSSTKKPMSGALHRVNNAENSSNGKCFNFIFLQHLFQCFALQKVCGLRSRKLNNI